MRTDHEYRELLEKCKGARDEGPDTLSAGERVVAALVLNRPEWLTEMGYTMAEAVDRIGLIKCSMLLEVQRDLGAQGC
ncbi:hypothetical protein GCM10023165_26290 [Variovorax defluvii]|uniref:Uncharacterized protein n=1 Tax=Variovorax defluvii TaxID=913761 RepID=A0ABP8HSH8_9BURK